MMIEAQGVYFAGDTLSLMAASMDKACASCVYPSCHNNSSETVLQLFQQQSLNLVCLVVCEQFEGVKMWTWPN